LGLLAALCGLVVCLLRPWTTDDLPEVWPYASRKPPGNAFGSVQALAANERLGKGWPADSLHGVLLVIAIWTLVLLASVPVAFMARRRAPWLHGRAARWLSDLASLVLVALPIGVAGLITETLAQVGAHALPALAALPVLLIAGALGFAVRPVWRIQGWGAVAAMLVLVVAVAGGTVGFSRWYTTSRWVSATTTSLPAAPNPEAPSRPGRVAWHLRSPNLDPVVRQSAGYTVVSDFYDDPRGDRSGEVHVYNSATGRLRWHYSRADAVMDVADLTADTLVLQAHDLGAHTTLLGFDLATGHRLWSAAPQQLQTSIARQSRVLTATGPSEWLITAGSAQRTAPAGLEARGRAATSSRDGISDALSMPRWCRPARCWYTRSVGRPSWRPTTRPSQHRAGRSASLPVHTHMNLAWDRAACCSSAPRSSRSRPPPPERPTRTPRSPTGRSTG
jgi:hypothetical protein